MKGFIVGKGDDGRRVCDQKCGHESDVGVFLSTILSELKDLCDEYAIYKGVSYRGMRICGLI